MYKRKNKAMSPWLSGFSLLGLLVVVAIMVYLFQMQSEVSISVYRSSTGNIKNIQDTILHNAEETMKQAEERNKDVLAPPPTTAPALAPPPTTAPAQKPAPTTAPAQKPAPTTRPAERAAQGTDGTVAAGTPLGPISPITPVAPMMAPTGGLNPTTAKTPAKNVKGILDARSKALEKMIEDN